MALVLALMVAVVLALPALPFLVGVAADSLIARFSGCGLATFQKEVAALPALIQTLVLLGRWLGTTAFALLSLAWLMAMLMFALGSPNERRHEHVLALLGYSSAGLVTLAVAVPVYSQMVCLAA